MEPAPGDRLPGASEGPTTRRHRHGLTRRFTRRVFRSKNIVLIALVALAVLLAIWFFTLHALAAGG